MTQEKTHVACCRDSGELLSICFDLALSQAFMNPLLAIPIMAAWRRRHTPLWLIPVRPREEALRWSPPR